MPPARRARPPDPIALPNWYGELADYDAVESGWAFAYGLVGAEGGEPMVSRVVLAHDGSSMRVLGGGLEHERHGFERHSYEAELGGFMDHLASEQDTVTVIVTDCLSGSMAGERWRARTQADKASRYRANELDNLEALEGRQRAVVYLWVHSHVGVTHKVGP